MRELKDTLGFVLGFFVFITTIIVSFTHMFPALSAWVIFTYLIMVWVIAVLALALAVVVVMAFLWLWKRVFGD